MSSTEVTNEKASDSSKAEMKEEAAQIHQSSIADISAVTFEEHLELAELSRARESKSHGNGDSDSGSGAQSPAEKPAHYIRDSEMENARRALRTASWASIFYLITTDILGPFNAPFAISQVGYVPGVILYVVMGAVACYTGLILWRLFCKLDSHQYPIKTYSDLSERVLGRSFRHFVTILQTVQLIINVGTLVLANGQAVEQIAHNHKFCFAIAILMWALFGMVIGQIRSLQNYGWLANSAVWINLLIIFTSMGFVAHSPPNFESAAAAFGVQPGPVVTAAFGSLPLFSRVNGIMNMVFAYGGAMIFPEFMAEMRRPMDFWKGMCCAQLLIGTCYLLYGVFVYSFQGQFTLPLAFQGVSKFSWQTFGNVLSLITAIIAAGLYGNIGIKVAYYEIVEGWFKGPTLMSSKGRVVWTGMVFLYWSLAYIIGSAIPQVQTVSGLVAAICIMQFTYTFPPLLLLAFYMRIDAARNDPGDTWRDFSRWRRGFLDGDRILYKAFNLVMFLGSAAMAGLGMYGSGTAIKATFEHGAATSFGCTSPV